MTYPAIQFFIDGKWCSAIAGRTTPVLNPATRTSLADMPVADRADLDNALAAAEAAFRVWKKVTPFERYKLMRKAAENLRAFAPEAARWMTQEQGKPIAEAMAEFSNAADILDWFAEEGRRAYGRIIPPRLEGIFQAVVKEPVGPVAAFTPWNFPVVQAIRKVAGAIAAGCSIILKGPEETPASCVAMVRAFADAGLPPGVLNLVFGVPEDISSYLIASPVIRKISFTGSTAVGRHLASLAGTHMKRATMELGGHGPVIVTDDVDVETTAQLLATSKYRNAGQVCISPTRFLVQKKVYGRFVERFAVVARGLKVGNGLEEGTQMGPLAHDRRLLAMESFVSDAVKVGARVLAGGGQVSGNEGYFFQPTVLTDVPLSARIMNEEPFGPVAPIAAFGSIDEVIAEANRLPYGLTAYVYTASAKTASRLSEDLEAGMVSINHQALPLAETPFGGVKDSGYGLEGGSEGLEAYLNSKLISRRDL